MENSTLGQRIKIAREKRGLYQDKLAEILGVTSGKIISNWETGIAKPDADKMVKLCSILGVSAAYMLDYYENEKESISDPEFELIRRYRLIDSYGKKIVDYAIDCEYDRIMDNLRAVKQIDIEPEDHGKIGRKFRRITYYDSAASAGTGQYLDNVKENTIKVLLNDVTEDADYVIPVSGDSMEPLYGNRDRICVKYQTSVEVGEIGIFIVNGDSYVKEFAGDRLVSLNPDYPDIPLRETDEIVCRGKVLGKV